MWIKMYRLMYRICGCKSNDHTEHDIDDTTLYSDEARRAWARLCAEIISHALAVMKNGSKWLDVGAGTGNFCNKMRDCGTECTLVEVSVPERTRLFERGYDVYRTLRDVPASVYDRVFCNAVIEHVDDPDEFARELFRVTQPGGLVFVGTINEVAILVAATLARLFTVGMIDSSHYVTRFHAHYYARSGWLRILTDAGFVLVDEWRYPYSRTAPPWRRFFHWLLRIQYMCFVLKKPTALSGKEGAR